MAARKARSQRPGTRRAGAARGTDRATGIGTWAWLVGGLVVAVIAVVVGIAVASGGASGSDRGTVVQGNGGTWTNISPNSLASEMRSKDFTLLNVKTPYIGEIQGTDLYIPYDQLAARAAELPADRHARIVVYCRTGNESAIAAQTLLDLGYTNIQNLDGGMTAWVASGRSIVQVARS
jgi:rhodanese-related sulfurtransferase